MIQSKRLKPRLKPTSEVFIDIFNPTFHLQPMKIPSSDDPMTTASPEMQYSVKEVESIIGYSFRRKRLLEEALTHSSFSDMLSYERLEFMGDAVLSLSISSHLLRVYPDLDPGQLTLLRAANVSTERLARVAVRLGIHRYVRHNAPSLLDNVREFVEAVSKEEDLVTYGGSVKAPKILADIVESIAAAVFVDVNYDIQKLWEIFRGVLEPLVTLEDLKQQPQPVTMLFEFCQKQGKKIDIRHWKEGAKIYAGVYVDGKSIANAYSNQKDIARLNAAKEALDKLTNLDSANTGMLAFCTGIDGPFEIESAKQKLHELCRKKNWGKPEYCIESDTGPAHDKKFICSVQTKTVHGILYMPGDEKSRRKDAENSAASMMIRALESANY